MARQEARRGEEKGYAIPEVWVSSWRKVMGFLAAWRMGALVEGSKPVTMDGWANSGRIDEIGESRVTRPRETHCRAAMDVRSLVQEASQKMASGWRGAALGERVSRPKDLVYA
jgi:hypothetical protein